jgi:hypothetical protein
MRVGEGWGGGKKEEEAKNVEKKEVNEWRIEEEEDKEEEDGTADDKAVPFLPFSLSPSLSPSLVSCSCSCSSSSSSFFTVGNPSFEGSNSNDDVKYCECVLL